MTKRNKWRMRRISRCVERHYKGLIDVLGLFSGLTGTAIFMIGWILVLCGEWQSVMWLTVGGFLIFGSCACFDYGRS